MVFHHEVVTRFAEAGLRLCPTLESMLNEDPSHQTERRGSGFTQATRFLSARINHPRLATGFDDLDIFCDWKSALDNHRLRHSLSTGQINTWRNWHRTPPELKPSDSLSVSPEDVQLEANRQTMLCDLVNEMELEESRLLTAMIRDLVTPRSGARDQSITISAWPKKLKVGSCPMAEKWFLELAHGFIPRKARCNLLLGNDGSPLLVEKTGMGDDHSCLSLRPLIMNGVMLPVGSLLAVEYDQALLHTAPQNHTIAGKQIRISDCRGFRMLRLTTLAVSGAHRRRAFSKHFESQVAEGLFEPEKTDISQLQYLAEEALLGAQAS